MNAGALHTIITDGVWYPERAHKRGKMKTMNSEPQCLWTTGVITKEYTALPKTEAMMEKDVVGNNTDKAHKV
eukprot:784713-Heterocapsa_arctica.AAC.1